MKRIYFDHGATTPMDKRILDAMKPYFWEKYGNASSLHSFGVEAREAVEEAREKVSKVINANANEIVFTSGGTESNNLALKGIAFANKSKGKHIITSNFEHHCILHAAEWLGKNGFDVTFLPVDRHGLVSPEQVENTIRKDTLIVSVMHANNEIGTIQPIEKIGKICRDKGVYFHTDAVQTYGKIPVDVEKMNIDMLSLSSHKLYGPKGVGALYVRKGIKIEPLSHGGGHEFGLRSGTENVSGLVGLGKAAELRLKDMGKDTEKLVSLRDRIIKGALKIENSFLNGHPARRLPGNANLWFRFVEGESLILRLDDKGIAASTGSACSSESLKPSHVLLAIGLRPEEAHGSLRLTLGKDNTKEEVDYFLEVIPGIVEKLREMSPFKKKYEFKGLKDNEENA